MNDNANQTTGKTTESRRLAFISHANPQDNVITLWLATRLASAGYEVWSDLTKLIGGELFWTDIEEAIRAHSVKFIALVSQSSVAKAGFLDELSVATAVERTEGLRDFVIPCRIDDYDFSDLPALVHRKNVIDFSGGWHLGLAKLLEKFDKDGVPRRLDEPSATVALWSKHFLNVDGSLVRADENVSTNWLPIVESPLSIRIVNRTNENALVREDFPWPVAPTTGRRLASFAAAYELTSAQTGAVTSAVEVTTEVYLGKEDIPRGGLTRSEARNTVADLTRQAWERYCKSKGLLAAELANGRLCWYLPTGGSSQVAVPYTDLDGTKRKKKLVGRSEKYQVYWHCAVEAFPFIGHSSRLTFVLHVVFTEDGRAPLASTSRAHRLRRSFCKNWWQWQWRELMLAFLSHLAGGESSIGLPVAKGRDIRVSVQPTRFIAPVTTPLAVSPEEELEEPLPADDIPDLGWDDELDEDSDAAGVDA